MLVAVVWHSLDSGKVSEDGSQLWTTSQTQKYNNYLPKEEKEKRIPGEKVRIQMQWK